MSFSPFFLSFFLFEVRIETERRSGSGRGKSRLLLGSAARASRRGTLFLRFVRSLCGDSRSVAMPFTRRGYGVRKFSPRCVWVILGGSAARWCASSPRLGPTGPCSALSRLALSSRTERCRNTNGKRVWPLRWPLRAGGSRTTRFVGIIRCHSAYTIRNMHRGFYEASYRASIIITNSLSGWGVPISERGKDQIYIDFWLENKIFSHP